MWKEAQRHLDLDPPTNMDGGVYPGCQTKETPSSFASSIRSVSSLPLLLVRGPTNLVTQPIFPVSGLSAAMEKFANKQNKALRI